MQQNTRVFVCFRVFEAEIAPNQNIRYFSVFLRPGFRKTRVFEGFCVWAAFMLPRVKCCELYGFLCVFEAEAAHAARVATAKPA